MNALSIAATALGLVALMASAVVVWRNAASTKAAEIWKAEAEAHKARGDRMEAGLGELRGEFAAYRQETSARIAHLEQENSTLRDLVTGRDQMERIEDEVRATRNEIRDALTHLELAIASTKAG